MKTNKTFKSSLGKLFKFLRPYSGKIILAL